MCSGTASSPLSDTPEAPVMFQSSFVTVREVTAVRVAPMPDTPQQVWATPRGPVRGRCCFVCEHSRYEGIDP